MPGFSLPFTLNYHSNGVKVADSHFPLGYGWMLNPGLRITRTVIGKADEQSVWDLRTMNLTYEYLLNLDSKNYSEDASHDIFSIHLPEHNTTFLLDPESTPAWKVLMANSPLKISPQFNKYDELTGFSVIDEKGITYKFGEQYVEKDPRTGSPTAWFLYEIILPGDTSNSITITWEKAYETYNAEEVYSDYHVIQDGYTQSIEQPGMPGPGYLYYSDGWGLDVMTQYLHLLKKIEMPNQTIDFTNTRDSQCTFLTELTVKDKNNKTIKECSFDYIRYSALSRLYISGEGTYLFNYYGDDGMSVFSQDYWGYYNGKNNSTLVPSFKIRISGIGSSLYYEFQGADRTIDATAMQNYMLKKVTYPTKGTMQIEYEPHQFETQNTQFYSIIDPNTPNGLSEGGGLRVKRTVSCAGDGAPDVVRIYKYGANEDGKGVIPHAPLLEQFVNEQFGYHQAVGNSVAYRQLVIGGTARSITYPTFNPNVYYKIVTEYEGDLKTTSHFKYDTNSHSRMFPYDGMSGYFAPFYISYYNNLAKNGAILEKRFSYKKNGSQYIPIEKEEYDYFTIGLSGQYGIPNMTTARKDTDLESGYGEFVPSHPMAQVGAYYAGSYQIDLSEYKVRGKKVTRYEGNDSIVTTQAFDYSYQDDRSGSLQRTSLTDSRGDVYSDYMYYAHDPEINTLMTPAQRLAVPLLKSKNRILQPLVYIRKKGEVELYKRVIQYKDYGNNLLLPEKEFYKKNGSPEEERITYQKYDIRGNLLGYTQDGVDKVTHLWAYGYQYPVARIEGATYAEVEGWLGASFITTLATSSTDVSDKLTNLRKVLSSKDVLVTTYLYQPLVGISGMIIPNDGRTNYEYDSSGRLIRTKDHYGKLMEDYEYHYKP